MVSRQRTKTAIMKKDRFDLESDIMDCWHIVDDLKTVAQAESLYSDEDKMQNALIGLESLYQLKFQKLWETFEQVVRRNELG
tara:strand:+ start:1316 stop:1561 length:246 start_codon:yes stop_codon:yes gene_type:complete